MHPTIEVVDSRYQDFRSLDRLQVLADNFSNGALVYGAAATGWEGLDLAHPPITVTADGKDFAECTGLRAGNPIDLLVAAVNHACQARRGRGRHLRHDRHPYRHGLHPAGGQDPRRLRQARHGRGLVSASDRRPQAPPSGTTASRRAFIGWSRRWRSRSRRLA